MSLFLGNLPQHLHREEIEQEFRRFGRNSVRIKDGFGFVIFDVREDADRALRALQGKPICGEHIDLRWSKKQPRNNQTFVRGGRFREPPRGRYDRDFDRGPPRGMRGRGFMRPPFDRRRTFFSRERERDREDHPRDRIDDYEEIRGRNSDDEVPDAGRRDGDIRDSDSSPAESGRWGQQVNSPDGSDPDGSDFERYEPNRDEHENQRNSGSYGSPAPGSPRERKDHSGDVRMKDLDNLKKQPFCIKCGLFGHLPRNCRRGNSSRPERFGQFRRRRDDDADHMVRGEEEFRRMRTISRGRAGAGRGTRLLGRHPRDGKGFHPLDMKRSSRSRERLDVDEGHGNMTALESRQRKRSKHRRSSRDGHHKKRIKRSNSRSSSSSSSSSSSHSDSDGESSRSRSLSSRSVSGRHSSSRSKSAYSKSRSGTHLARSASVSSDSRSRGIRSKSRSKSRTRTRSKSRPRSSADPSISLSPGRKSTPPHDKRSGFSSHPSEKQERASDANYEDMFVSNTENTEPKVHYESMNPQIHTGHDDTDEVQVGNNIDHSRASSGDVKKEELHTSTHQKELTPFGSEKMFVDIEGNLDNGDPLAIKPAAVSAAVSQIQDTLRISPQELCTALKHYGLETPEESVPGVTVEMYFGAARFWPWEMIYYRRLKKGPISTENYARRIMQNKEFGIVDRYIRSSSGWTEPNGSDT